MQFHLNGFKPGDPHIAEPAANSHQPGQLPEQVDVLIVGCGPAGLTLAAQLAQFPDITTCIVEQKAERLTLGQADGIACRTMEIFEAFGFSERVMREGYWVNETTFWKPDPDLPDQIKRSGRVQDVEDGLCEFPHMILNQARIHDFLLNVMHNSASRLEPIYSHLLVDLKIDAVGIDPIKAQLQQLDAEKQHTKTVRARYVVGCDGARSSVRQCIGQRLKGDSANHAWGVMDVLADSSFPDVRFKSLIQSNGEGSIVLIPREGGYLFRIYVELDKLDKDERAASRKITREQLIAAAQRILHPYTLEVKEIPWWSVYEIGQRLCSQFDNTANHETLPQVFIAGDACHTHSPKAGQGMNVSISDSFNLGWKLASVIRGHSPPQLLRSYSVERQGVAKELIDFDREWASILSASSSGSGGNVNDGEFQRHFIKHGRYTAGTAIQYPPSMITGSNQWQHLANGFVIGTRFHSAPVVRLADAKSLQLGHVLKADGRWRLLIFAAKNDKGGTGSATRQFCDYLSYTSGSPLNRFRPECLDIDSHIDVRAIYQQHHHELQITDVPDLLFPTKGTLGLHDYEKVLCAEQQSHGDIFNLREINRDQPCVVVIRPDQYVAHILPLAETSALEAFFANCLTSC